MYPPIPVSMVAIVVVAYSPAVVGLRSMTAYRTLSRAMILSGSYPSAKSLALGGKTKPKTDMPTAILLLSSPA